MAEGHDKSVVGAIAVDVEVNAKPMDAGLNEAKAKAQAAGHEIAQKLNVGPMPIGDKSAAFSQQASAMQNLNQQAGNLSRGIRGAAGGFLQMITTGTRLVGVVGLVTSGIAALAVGMYNLATKTERANKNTRALREEIERTFRSFGSVEKTDLEKQLESVNEALAEADKKARELYLSGKITAAQRRRNVDTALQEAELARQRIFQRDYEQTMLAAANRQQEIDREVGEQRIESRRKILELENQMRAESERAANEFADREAEREEQRIRDRANALASMFNQAFPGAQRREQTRIITEAWINAKNPIEQMLIGAIGNALANVERKKIEEIFKDALNAAIAQQAAAAGAQNVPVLLRDISVQLQAIQATIPRNSVGLAPTLPGGF